MSRLPPNGERVLKRGAKGARVLDGDGRGVAKRYEANPAPAGGRSIDERLRIGVRNGTASTRAAGGGQAQLTWAVATSA